MKSRVVRLIVAALLFNQSLLLVMPAQSAPLVIKAGTSCKPKGSVVIYKNIKFTCVTSGKKLVWNKGVALTKAQILAAANKAKAEAAAKAAAELKAQQ